MEAEREYCAGVVVDKIRITLTELAEHLEPVLKADVNVYAVEEEKRVTSPLRADLEDILTKLNILASRVEL